METETNIYWRSLRAGLPAFAIAIVVFVIFRHKAFNIDDVTFLTMADHMRHDPLHPAAVQMVVNGTPPAWISNGMWSGPVMPAMLLPSVSAGGPEWLAHLAMLVVFLIGLLATGAFALRLGASDASARWAVLLTATSPAVIAMASTCMPDVPTMSFAALGAERLLAFRDKGGAWRAVIAALALALCVLSRQHGVLVFACMVPVAVAAWPGSLRELGRVICGRVFLSTVATLVGAVAIIVATYAAMKDPHAHESLAATPLQVVNFARWRVNLANLPAQWVLSFPLGLAWAWLHGRRMLRSRWCWGAALLGVFLAIETQVVYACPSWLWWQVPITALGMAVLVDLIVDAVRRHDPVDLGLAAWLFIGLPMAVYSHLPPKYLVPAAPAMAVLLVRHADHAAARRVFAVIAAAGLLVGILIIRADSRLGAVGRRGGKIAASYVQRGDRVWFDGTWGFQWYAMQGGAIPMTSADPKPQPGDIVVAATGNWMVGRMPNKKLLKRIKFRKPGGRILHRPAGFFSNVDWGPLPWWWSKAELTPIEVWQIEPLAPEPPAASTRTAG